jgi:hypothetical protein
VYGYAVTEALADEGWGIPAQVVEEGLEPTLSERLSGQLVIFSTAHRRATALVPVRRAGMLAAWAAPKSSLLLEWSAARGSDLGDRDAWRQASPHWTPGRERMLEAKLSRVQDGHSEDPDEDDPEESFRSQYLNVWPARRLVSTTRSELLLDSDQWVSGTDLYAVPPPAELPVCAVEDFYGLGAAAAAAVPLPDGRVLTWGGICATRTEAYQWVAGIARPGSTLWLGGSLPTPEARSFLPEGVVIEQAGTRVSQGALPMLRAVVRAGKVAHPGDRGLLAQVRSFRVVPTTSGGLMPAHKGVRSDLLRATAWAVAAVAAPELDAAPLDFFVY